MKEVSPLTRLLEVGLGVAFLSTVSYVLTMIQASPALSFSVGTLCGTAIVVAILYRRIPGGK